MPLSLLWRFAGDNAPLVQAMSDLKAPAEKIGADTGKLFGAQFKSLALKLLGAGAIVAELKKIMDEAASIQAESTKRSINVEAVQELERAAKITGLTVDELLEAAPKLGKAFEDLLT